MMPLHPTDIATLNGSDGWYNFQLEQMHNQIEEWRRNIAPGSGANVVDGVGHYDDEDDEPATVDEPARSAPRPRTAAQATAPAARPGLHLVPPAGDDPDDGPEEQAAAEVEQEMAEVPERHPEAYEDVEPETMSIDPSRPTPRPAEKVTWGDKRPAANSRDEAIEALHKALANMLDRPGNVEGIEPDERIEPEDAHSVTFGPGALHTRYPFRSRPWFSDTLKDLLAGKIPLPEGMEIERVRPGVYRLSRALAGANRGGDTQ
jgi:hypothetical protein